VTDGDYVPRLADAPLDELITAFPAVMVVGPRACGKTTTAGRAAAQVMRLDHPDTVAVVRADPDAALRRAAEPLLIDEWQEVPEILGAVKRAVDENARPGRFLLAGSVDAPRTAGTWPGTGRIVRLAMHGLTEREAGNRLDTGLLTKIIAGDLGAVAAPDVAPDLYTYVDRATRSGFPFPRLHLTGVARTRWLSSYLDDVTTRDVVLSGERRDPLRLRRYLEVLGLSSAGLPALSTLTEAADLDGRTVNDYDRLLQRLYLLDLVPAWSNNRLSRLVKTPKRYLTDPALALAAAGLDAAAVLASADQLGRTLDSLVAAQVRPELVNHVGARLSHLRTDGGRQEIDLLVELGAGRVVALEVKAGTAPSLRDARHLIWLRDQLGEQFVRGVVLHTGSGVFELSDRVWALPIAAWWG
jgi:uncharacterized protein